MRRLPWLLALAWYALPALLFGIFWCHDLGEYARRRESLTLGFERQALENAWASGALFVGACLGLASLVSTRRRGPPLWPAIPIILELGGIEGADTPVIGFVAGTLYALPAAITSSASAYARRRRALSSPRSSFADSPRPRR